MFKIKSKQNKKSFRKPDSESGAIMLEVIAVLSLMALMGAALFRQIYLRNQELSNVQMASEIRVVKEAFAAWIQAHPELKSNPAYNDGIWYRVSNDMNALTEIASYLPLAYDELLCTYTTNAAGEEVCNESINYALFGRCDPLGPEDGYTRCVGLVVPYADVLPEDADWNFRRAAHVAMLIGADGGVFGKGMTNDEPLNTNNPGEYIIVGSLGSWTETLDDATNLHHMTTYAATTGMDVFQPEIELAAVGVGLDNPANLALQRVHVYGAFTAGGAGTSDKCYTIQHKEANRDDTTGNYTIKNDDIENPGSNCWPAFYVESDRTEESGVEKGTGTVRVANDLTVGQEYDGSGNATTAAMRFDKNGMIVFEKATVRDPQTSHNINYVLDPQYTSVMNDIKIMSRGGAKLSEILPNYILKEVVQFKLSRTGGSSAEIHCMYNEAPSVNGGTYNSFVYDTGRTHTPYPAGYCVVQVPSCPKSYTPAIAVQPTSWDTGLIVPSSTSTEITSTVTGQGTGTGSISITNVTLDTDGSGNLLNTGTGTGTVTFDSTHPITIDPHPLTQGVCVKIQENYNSGTPEVTAWHMDDTVSGTTNRKWRVIMGYQNKNNDCDVNETNFPKGARIDATVYTYCYFDKHRFLDTSLSNTECLENGFSWEYDPSTNAYKCFRFTSSGTRTTLKETGGRENLTADDCGKITTQGTCELMGCTWTVSGGSGTCSHP